MGRGFRLFTVFGFEVRIDYSWSVIFILVLWTLSFGVFPAAAPEQTPRVYLAMGLVGTLLFFASIIAHELSHSLVARRKGIPIEGITLFIFGGLAHTKMDMQNPDDEFQIAGIGPVSSVLIGLLFYGVAWTGGQVGWSPVVTEVARYLGFINIVLAVFNMLPGFPLDGGRIFRALAWKYTGDMRKATRWASNAGKGLGYGLIFLGILNFLGGNPIGGLWMVFIGWFVRTAAEASYVELVVRHSLENLLARDVMTPDPTAVSADMPLQDFVEEHVLRGRHQSYPVMTNGHPAGIITLQALKQIPREEWARHTVRDAMVDADTELHVEPTERMDRVLDRLRGAKARRVLVVDRGALAGIITQTDVARLLERWQLLEGDGGR